MKKMSKNDANILRQLPIQTLYFYTDIQTRESHRRLKNPVFMQSLVWLPVEYHVVVTCFHFQGSNGESWKRNLSQPQILKSSKISQ